MQQARAAVLASAVLAGCGFQAAPTTTDPTGDGSTGSDSPSGPTICWTISDTTNAAHWTACTATAVSAITITDDTSFDTERGESSPPGLHCASLTDTSVNVCALAAASIQIAAGKKLSAHGPRALAILGHTIDLEGTIDVASHIGGQRGAGTVGDCNPSMIPAQGLGGGAGGAYGDVGGAGGDEGAMPDTGGHAGDTISSSEFHAGCDGRLGGDGAIGRTEDGFGGAPGGAVWIASDTGILTLGPGAVINASGAGGFGTNHGGSGGGSGGMIVLQSSTITYDPAATLYANGGGGGGGGFNGMFGSNGTDPLGPSAGGAGGDGATSFDPPPGRGGTGYPAASTALDGATGDPAQHGGGGGGGGSAGNIRIASTTPLAGMQISPPAIAWAP